VRAGMSRREDLRAARRVTVLGGSSEIALAIVRALQEHSPREVALLGRDPARLGAAAEKLRRAGVERVLSSELDALALDTHDTQLRVAEEALGGAELVILAVGILGAEQAGVVDPAGGAAVLATNLLGAGSLLLHTAARMKQRKGGTIVVLSSVAAQRPRRSNAVYGASKAGLDALAHGLADGLREHGVRILVVRPGFVRTHMTAGLSAAPLAVGPDEVAAAVLQALERGRDTVWAPAAIRPVMFILRALPRTIWRRIKL